MKRLLLLSTVVCLASLPAAAATAKKKDMKAAEEKPMQCSNCKYSDNLTIYGGQFEVGHDDFDAEQFGLEYRFKPAFWDVVRPIVGANFTTDGALYGYVGVGADFKFDNGFYIMPNTAVGAYAGNDGKDLGGAIEFRSGLEVGYEFKCGKRIGLAYNHISNGGIYSDNPGAESLIVTFSLPTNQIFGR